MVGIGIPEKAIEQKTVRPSVIEFFNSCTAFKFVMALNTDIQVKSLQVEVGDNSRANEGVAFLATKNVVHPGAQPFISLQPTYPVIICVYRFSTKLIIEYYRNLPA